MPADVRNAVVRHKTVSQASQDRLVSAHIPNKATMGRWANRGKAFRSTAENIEEAFADACSLNECKVKRRQGKGSRLDKIQACDTPTERLFVETRLLRG
jgi:hypothetical protein